MRWAMSPQDAAQAVRRQTTKAATALITERQRPCPCVHGSAVERASRRASGGRMRTLEMALQNSYMANWTLL